MCLLNNIGALILKVQENILLLSHYLEPVLLIELLNQILSCFSKQFIGKYGRTLPYLVKLNSRIQNQEIIL